MPKLITIIGAGPAGYTAAFSAAHAGFNVNLFEYNKLGGTCLNTGCIPTKTFKVSAELIEASKRFAEFGLNSSENVTVNPLALIQRKEKICQILRTGLEKACVKNKINLIKAKAHILNNTSVEYIAEDGSTTILKSDAIIICTGSNILELSSMPYDHKVIINSDDALNLEYVPKRMLIVGGGVIGCEMAFIYNAFGAEVTIVEGADRLLPIAALDEDISKLLLREMKKRKIKIYCNSLLQKISSKNNIAYADMLVKGVEAKILEADIVLVTVGRVPKIEGLGLKQAGIKTDAHGWIEVDDNYQTNLANVYAIGDILGPTKNMLAHVAYAEANYVIEHLQGKDGQIDYNCVPFGIFTAPEIACVGLSEKQAQERGINVKSSIFQARELGKAQVMGELAGFFKIVFDADNNKILGVHIACVQATDLIAEAALAIKMGATVADIARTIHAHPTLAEGLYESALLSFE